MPRIHDSATEGLRKREVVRAGADGTGARDVGEVIGVRWDSSVMERVLCMEMACVALAVRTHDATGRYGLLCLCIESKSAALYLADQIRKSHYMDTSCARSQARE